VCERIFLEKADDALKYPTRDENGNFLVGVGLSALIETCRKNKILLSGIATDSASRYLTQNYLGVCRITNLYQELNSKAYGPACGISIITEARGLALKLSLVLLQAIAGNMRGRDR
jgi:hypothetical protein